MIRPKILVFASGTPEGGGSGLENLVKASHTPTLEADIIGVVSNHNEGGVRKRADRLKIPFVHFPLPRQAEDYIRIVDQFNPDFVALSGWLKMVYGLNPRTTFNIHPGPVPRFGGKGMHGHHVHQAVLEAYRRREIQFSEVTMHFITTDPNAEYDPAELVFFRYPVEIDPNDTVESLAHRVNRLEHYWQPIITNKVIKGEIRWDGKNPESIVGAEDWTK